MGCHCLLQRMKVKSEREVTQSCLTLSGPMDCSPPGSSIHGTFQARVLEWVAIAFSNACKWKVKVKSLSPVWLLATPWTAAYQAPPSMGFARQEYWSGVPSSSPFNSTRKLQIPDTRAPNLCCLLTTDPLLLLEKIKGRLKEESIQRVTFCISYS